MVIWPLHPYVVVAHAIPEFSPFFPLKKAPIFWELFPLDFVETKLQTLWQQFEEDLHVSVMVSSGTNLYTGINFNIYSKSKKYFNVYSLYVCNIENE